MPVSAINGTGTGELLDKILEFLIESPSEPPPISSEYPKFAIIGKPNVGKSTLINMLLGEERNIVSNIPGTTRDAIHSVYNKFGKNFIIIDTAGLRKKTSVNEDIEFYSVIRAINSIEESDVCLLILDASEGISAQDLSIVSLVEKRRKGLVILLNKWDLIEQNTKSAETFITELKEKLAPFEDVPIITTSALNKVRIMKAIEEALHVYENKRRKISTSELNKVMLEAISAFHPPSHKGKFINIKYVTQVSNISPAFAFFCNHPHYLKESYKRYLENKLRENFDFKGVPLILLFKKK
jgi:GTP-binding protein